MSVELWIVIITALIGIAGFFLAKSNLLKNKAIEAIWIGIQHAFDAYVDARKKASEDGTITPEEAAEAKKIAINKALEVAKGPVKDLLLAWGTDKIGAIITHLVQSKKNTDPPVPPVSN